MKLHKYSAALILFVLAVIFGLWFPNLDLRFSVPGIIIHRSALTHSILLPLVWYQLAGKKKPVTRFITMGLFLGVVVHLTFDIYPALFGGGALIYFPWLGRFDFMPVEVAGITALVVSSLWFAGNIYWGINYYLKSTGSKTWINLLAYLSVVIVLFGYAYYCGRGWLVPAVALGAGLLINF